MTAPDRIWIEDERPEGGQCHVHTEPTEGALLYGVEYVRADLARATLAEALAVPEVAELIEAYEDILDYGIVFAKKDQQDRLKAAKDKYAAIRGIGGRNG